MTVFEIYIRPRYYWKHKAGMCTRAFFYTAISLLLTYISPLIISYSSAGFWNVTNTYMEQPIIKYKKQVFLVLDMPQPGKYLAWSSYSNLNRILQSNVRCPVLTSIETDSNGDGIKDELKFTASMPLTRSETVTSFRLLLLFDYKLSRMSSFRMETLAFVSHSAVSGGSLFTSYGELRLNQKTPLRDSGVDARFNTAIIDASSLSLSTYDFVNIFRSYFARNITTRFTNDYSVWESGRGASKPFVIQLFIKYPTEIISYHPGFGELIKWAWIQYVCVLLVFLWVFRKLNYVVFSGGLFNTIVVPPIHKLF